MTDNAGNPVPPSYDASTPPAYNPTGGPGTAVNPGRTLGIVGLILGIVGFFVLFLASIAGLIVSIIGLNRSKKAGQKNGLALAGIIVSIIAIIANIIAAFIIAAAIALAASVGGDAVAIYEQCQADPTSTVEYQGQQIPCEQLLGQLEDPNGN